MIMKPEDIKKRIGAFPVASVAVGDIIFMTGSQEAFPVSKIKVNPLGFVEFHSEDPEYEEDVLILNPTHHVRGWFKDAGNLPEGHRSQLWQGERFAAPRFDEVIIDYTLKAPITVMRDHARWMRQCEDVRIQEHTNKAGDKGWAIGQAEPFRPIMFIKNKKMAEAILVLWRRICKEFIG